MSYVALRAAIKAKLDTLAPVTVKAVYNGQQDEQASKIASWPVVELMRMQTEPEYLTNREDLQGYIFAINIYQKTEENNGAEIEVAMDSVIDTIMQTFLRDLSLGGVANARITPIQNAGSVLTWMGVLCRRDTIFLKCRVIKSMDE